MNLQWPNLRHYPGNTGTEVNHKKFMLIFCLPIFQSIISWTYGSNVIATAMFMNNYCLVSQLINVCFVSVLYETAKFTVFQLPRCRNSCVCNTLTSTIFRHFCVTHKQGPCRTIYNNVSLFKNTENPWRLVQNREIQSDLSLCSNRPLGAYVSAVISLYKWT
jgi:hypothetical protein